MSGLLLIASLLGTLATDSVLFAGEIAYRQDKDGSLAPAMPYPAFIQRSMNFVLNDLDNGWAKGNCAKDEAGNLLPAYLGYALADEQHRLGVAPYWANQDVVFPASHHAGFMRFFLAYWRYTGNADCLSRARQLADWNLAHRTPPDCRYGSLFYSTYHLSKPTADADGDAIMTDKPALMALALLELQGATGEQKYRQGAVAVAATLARTQLPAGNWAFRVRPKSGEVREAYTSSAIYAALLFEELELLGDKQWREPKQKALHWILEGPAKDMLWNGFYEDIGKAPQNRTNYDCIDTARWLVAHRAGDPSYLPLARKLHDWTAAEFVERNKAWAPAEGLREQKVCFYTMGGHTAHWALLLGDLYAATGEESFCRRALDACALVTYWMREDSVNMVGPNWMHGDQVWFSCHLGTALLVYEALCRFPEKLSDGKPHLVAAGGAVRDVQYAAGSLRYTALAAGRDTLLLPAKPRVQVAGTLLDDSKCVYDAATTVCRVDRPAGSVEIGW